MDRKMQEVERIVLGQPEIRSGFAALDIEERGQVNSGIMFLRMYKPDQREATQPRSSSACGASSPRSRDCGRRSSSSASTTSPARAARRPSPTRSAVPTSASSTGRPAGRRAPGGEPGFVDVDTNLDLEQPQLFVTVDRERAADLGLDAATIFETVYALIAGREVGSFTDRGKRYDVRIKVLPSQAGSPRTSAACRCARRRARWCASTRWSTSATGSARSTSTGPTASAACC
jgi:multidrug efflux pump subunit AcrB